MSRVLQLDMRGEDVALLQRDLNVWYRYWGAPASELLDRDGHFGAKTERAFRRVRYRLGLAKREEGGKTAGVAARPAGRAAPRALPRRQAGGPGLRDPAGGQAYAGGGRTRQDHARVGTRLRKQFKAMKAVDLRPEIVANVVNQSSRNGVKPRLIVLHTTEAHNRPGLADLHGLVSCFDNPASQASSHIANDADGNDARMVPDERKAWTQASFNSVSLSIEQIGHASQKKFPESQLRNTAQWIAHWSKKYGIPITRSLTHGVCQHRDLGAAGGGHVRLRPELPDRQGPGDGEGDGGMSAQPTRHRSTTAAQRRRRPGRGERAGV